MRSKLKIAGLLGSVAVILTLIIGPLVYAQQNQSNDLVFLAAKYHLEANDIVNNNLIAVGQIMLDLEENPENRFEYAKRLSILDTEADCLKDKDNLSVYCLNAKLEVKRKEFIKELNDIPLVISNNITNFSDQSESKVELVAELIRQSTEVKEQTLDAYGQIIVANLMHTENMVTLNEIDNLDDSLNDLIEQIELIPQNFANVSTAYCK